MLGLILDAAVDAGTLARSPLDGRAVARPRVERKARPMLEGADVWEAVNAITRQPYADLVAFIAATGCRQGEARALRWADVDLKKGRATFGATLSRKAATYADANGRALTREEAKAMEKQGATVTTTEGEWVFGTPKTAASRRTVGLAPRALAAVKAAKERHAAARDAAGDLWTEHGAVFTMPNGAPVDSGAVLDAWQAVAPGMRLHDLRHAFITAAAAAGMHPGLRQSQWIMM